jgi:hypothetical protein
MLDRESPGAESVWRVSHPTKVRLRGLTFFDIVPFSCSSYEHSYLTVVTELSTHISLPMLWEFVANENVFGYHAKK